MRSATKQPKRWSKPTRSHMSTASRNRDSHRYLCCLNPMQGHNCTDSFVCILSYIITSCLMCHCRIWGPAEQNTAEKSATTVEHQHCWLWEPSEATRREAARFIAWCQRICSYPSAQSLKVLCFFSQPSFIILNTIKWHFDISTSCDFWIKPAFWVIVFVRSAMACWM